jgi:hypothetical protein
MNMLRRVGIAFATLVSCVGLSLSTGSPAVAYGCGDDAETQWTGLVASVWTGEAFINGTPEQFTVVLTNAGNEAVMTPVNPLLPVYLGQFDWDQGGWDMVWYAEDDPSTTRYTIYVDGDTCGLNNRVTYAVGETWTYASGYVGTFTMTRVV